MINTIRHLGVVIKPIRLRRLRNKLEELEAKNLLYRKTVEGREISHFTLDRLSKSIVRETRLRIKIESLEN